MAEVRAIEEGFNISKRVLQRSYERIISFFGTEYTQYTYTTSVEIFMLWYLRELGKIVIWPGLIVYCN